MVQYGESVDCFYSGDSRKSCNSCESGESRVSDESGDPGKIGDYDKSLANLVIHDFTVTLVIQVNL